MKINDFWYQNLEFLGRLGQLLEAGCARGIFREKHTGFPGFQQEGSKPAEREGQRQHPVVQIGEAVAMASMSLAFLAGGCNRCVHVCNDERLECQLTTFSVPRRLLWRSRPNIHQILCERKRTSHGSAQRASTQIYQSRLFHSCAIMAGVLVMLL